MKDLIEAAKAMVATAFGNTSGLDKDDQISAMKLAAAALDEALKAFEAKRGDEGWDEDKALDECLGPYAGQE